MSDQTTSDQDPGVASEQYRAIFEATSDGLAVNDLETGLILEANPAFCRMHGYEQMVGMHPNEFTHRDSRYLFEEYVRTAKAGGQCRWRCRHIRSDGSSFDVEVIGRAFTYKGNPAMLGVVRDVSEQMRGEQLLEDRVEERTRELSTLLNVTRKVASTLDLQELLKVILEQVRVIAEYDRSSFSLLEGDVLVVHSVDWRWGQGEGLPEGTRIPVSRAPNLWGLLNSPEPVIIGDVTGDSVLARQYREAVGAAGEGVRSWMGVPLMSRNKIIGLLALSKFSPEFFTERHAGLARAIADQVTIAIENARLYEQAQLLAATEERQRLARELHDSVSQAIYGVALGARTARTLQDRNPAEAIEPMEYVISLAEAALAEMRALIFELRPESLANEGLVAAIGKRVAATGMRYGIAVEWNPPDEPDVPLGAKEAVYRVVQEALHNVVKHSKATQANIVLNAVPEALSFCVSDNGIGFDPGQSFSGHFGLQSMRERLEGLGGGLQIESELNSGTSVSGSIPLT